MKQTTTGTIRAILTMHGIEGDYLNIHNDKRKDGRRIKVTNGGSWHRLCVFPSTYPVAEYDRIKEDLLIAFPGSEVEVTREEIKIRLHQD